MLCKLPNTEKPYQTRRPKAHVPDTTSLLCKGLDGPGPGPGSGQVQMLAVKRYVEHFGPSRAVLFSKEKVACDTLGLRK
jgi:hypothetical protein